MCVRMAKYPVTWNIISFTYAEEKLNKVKPNGNVPTQPIIEMEKM